MSEETKEPEKKPTADEKTMEMLHLIDQHKAWREKITVKMRADELYWLVYLIEEGIEARKNKWTENGKKRMDMGELMSIYSFRQNLETLVTEMKTFLEKKSKKK